MTTDSKPQSRNDDEPDFSEPAPVAKCRQEFEAWASAPEHNCYLKRIEFGPQGGQYYHGHVELAWRAWLEASTQADAEIARIKSSYGCARLQGSTQFCAEVIAKDRRIAELEHQLSQSEATLLLSKRLRRT